MRQRSGSSRVPEFFRAPSLAVSRIALVLSLAVTVGVVCAQEQSATSISREVKDVFERSAKAVVKIRGFDDHSEIAGTGFFVDPTGTIFTAYSVGGEAGNLTVEYDGKKYPARQIMADDRSSLALLKIDLATPALPIGKSDELEIATPVVVIGFPLDLPKTPSFGMIAGFDRKYLGRYLSTTHLRVNLPTQRGEAGAPVLNLKGEVVGILVGKLEDNSACYALPIKAAEKIRGDFVRFGEVRHGWIGANVGFSKEPAEGSNAEITELFGTTPAKDSGLRLGDILLQVGNVAVREPEDVLDASFFITAGDTIPITVVRSGQKLTFDIQADFHPVSKMQRPPIIAAPVPSNRSIPLNLQSTGSDRTP